jgi:hypothetical protein
MGALVEDVHLMGRRAGHFGGVGAADEDSAVGIGIDPELGPELEIAIAVLGDQEAVALVGRNDAVRQLPVGIADLVPIAEIRRPAADKERAPNGGARLGGNLHEQTKCI